MANNRYCELIGSKYIKEDFENINIGFEKVQTEMDANKQEVTSYKATTNQRLGEIEADIDNLSFTGSSHDPLVTSALVDVNGQNFGPGGEQTYLDGRLSKWENRQTITSIDQPENQPDGGVWNEELSSEAIDEEGLYIQNMVVQDDAPGDTSVLWGDE